MRKTALHQSSAGSECQRLTKGSSAELTAARLAEILIELDRERLLAMAIAARGVARVDASERVADACIALAQKR